MNLSCAKRRACDGHYTRPSEPISSTSTIMLIRRSCPDVDEDDAARHTVPVQAPSCKCGTKRARFGAFRWMRRQRLVDCRGQSAQADHATAQRPLQAQILSTTEHLPSTRTEGDEGDSVRIKMRGRKSSRSILPVLEPENSTFPLLR